MKCPNCQTACITNKQGHFQCLKCNFITAKATHKIQCLMAWVLVDEDGNESIPAFKGPNGQVMPMVGGNPQVILSMKTVAEEIGQRVGMPVKLLSFSERVEV